MSKKVQNPWKKARGTVKEAKTWARRLGLILYIKSQRKQKEIAEKAKESTRHATNRISSFVNCEVSYLSEAVTSLMGVVSLP